MVRSAASTPPIDGPSVPRRIPKALRLNLLALTPLGMFVIPPIELRMISLLLPFPCREGCDFQNSCAIEHVVSAPLMFTAAVKCRGERG